MKKLLFVLIILSLAKLSSYAQSHHDSTKVIYEYALLIVSPNLTRQDMIIIHPDGKVEKAEKISLFGSQTIDNKVKVMNAINYLGKLGYELVKIQPDTTDIISSEFIFKRRVVNKGFDVKE